ncbi:MAG: hypothetical protein AAFY82_03855 [Pseudomonadota bacterium]
MRDLREDLDPIWRLAYRVPAPEAGAKVIMFVSALRGEGTTSMAASFASIAARRSDKPAWLVDLDLKRNRAFSGFERRFARDIGKPGRAFDASLRQPPIYAVSPHNAAQKHDKLLTAHEIEGLPLLVTRFRRERLREGQVAALRQSPKWWAALRKISSWTIVDAPALERSAAALTMAAEADGIVLVVEADRTKATDVAAAVRDLEAKKGNVLGAIINKVGGDARLADRFSA